MPIISVFYGIIITMYVDDHNPPHFNAKYGEYIATFLKNGEIDKGTMPCKQRKLIEAWSLLHEDELNANWDLAKSEIQPIKIEPLR